MSRPAAYADFLIDRGELKSAEEAAAELGDSVFAQLLRGRILLEQGDARGALAAVEAGIRLWPNNPAARYLAGIAAEALGDWERALSEYREAVRAGSGQTDAALALARLHRALGEPVPALEFAAAHARSHPEQTEGYVEMVRAAIALGRREAAEKALARLQGVKGAEIAAALASRPGAAHLHDLRARVLDLSGAPPAESRQAFERALAIDPAYAPALAGLAQLSWRGGEGARAIELFDRAARSQPQEPEYAYAAAGIELASGSPAGAQARLRSLVERHPYHPSACNDLAWLLAERKEDLDLALELARRANRFEPVATTFDTLGWVQLQRGEAEQAAISFARAVELAPDEPGRRYRLGRALAATGDRDSAIRELRAALEAGKFPEEDAASAELARLSAGTPPL